VHPRRTSNLRQQTLPVFRAQEPLFDHLGIRIQKQPFGHPLPPFFHLSAESRYKASLCSSDSQIRQDALSGFQGADVTFIGGRDNQGRTLLSISSAAPSNAPPTT
jgi:hypothetical protein